MALTGKQCLSLINDIALSLNHIEPTRSIIAIDISHGVEQAVILLGVLFSKHIPLLLNNNLSLQKKNKIFQSCDVDYSIEEKTNRNDPQESDKNGFTINKCLLVKTNRLIRKSSRCNVAPDAALIIFTSGTSGKPKAVVHSIQGLHHTVREIICLHKLDKDVVSGVILPISHSMSLATQFLPTLLAGGTAVFLKSFLHLGNIYRKILEYDINNVALIADMLYFLNIEKQRRNLAAANKVQVFQMAGGEIFENHLLKAITLFPNAVIFKGYGLTEVFRVSSICSKDRLFFKNTAGRPIPGISVRIKGENGHLLKPGCVGEICVHGKSFMAGYLGHSVPICEKDGYFSTGDFGYIAENGCLFVQDRIDGIFKSNGRKISCSEIERTVTKFGSYTKVVCLPIHCEIKGKIPVLFIENVNQAEFWITEAKKMIRFLRNEFQPYKIPKHVFIMRIFPRMVNGKVDRMILEKIHDIAKAQCATPLNIYGIRFYRVPSSGGKSRDFKLADISV